MPLLLLPLVLPPLLLLIFSANNDDAKNSYHRHHLSSYYRDESSSSECTADVHYSKKRTLKRAYDMPFAALFRDNRGQSTFEVSDVTIVGDDVYAMCDNPWSISKFSRDLDPFSPGNVQVGNPHRVDGNGDGGGDNDVLTSDNESGYEAIFEYGELFYVVRESVYHDSHRQSRRHRNYRGKGTKKDEGSKRIEEGGTKTSGNFHAIIEDIRLHDNNYEFVRG